ncbi:hypothetical protein [Desulfotalea psychrophila]|uniref:Uncharacterized protein n=1 Tax=Desulfotalea psychrophila (strain LSv54 / DSM 12343) TaxID=177439 RepID=Q6AR94_DESPS|nr:hypothetical protein [Desulfotalea psychrophila]CAG35130.1 unknown protein [Desulfotalea psychrophila LSv54]
MKKIGLSFVILCVLASTVAMASDKQGTSKVGGPSDEEPCTCVFNNNRQWNPEKVLWNNAYWKCSNYKNDGTCSEVKKIEDIILDEPAVIQDNKIERKSSGKTPVNVKQSDVNAIGRDCKIIFKNGDVLSGTLQNQTFSVKATYGTLPVNTSDILSITFK